MSAQDAYPERGQSVDNLIDDRATMGRDDERDIFHYRHPGVSALSRGEENRPNECFLNRPEHVFLAMKILTGRSAN